MTDKLQAVRGTHDILIDDYKKFSSVTNLARKISSLYGFDEISTPIFEFTKVFKRTLGESSDIVSKEMYSFDDRNGESLTLRPEFTASIARSFINGGLGNQFPLKLFSTGPLFRYERPQKGRQRQFHQINFEILGNEQPQVDIELIAMGSHILRELNISDKVTLQINSLGCEESRASYKKTLIEYLSDFKNDLSEDSKKRLESNPLRILDSKDENDRKILEEAPEIEDCYTDFSKDFFNEVQKGLNSLGIHFEINKKLVRGMDYYCHTAFEFVTNELGAQNAVLAGGRYDGLIKMMGGSPTPAVGFAGGIERLMALSEIQAIPNNPIFIIPIGQQAEEQAFVMAQSLRLENFSVELSYSGNVKKRMKKANQKNAVACIIFGEDEIKNNIVKVKNLINGEENEVSTSLLLDKLEIFKG